MPERHTHTPHINTPWLLQYSMASLGRRPILHCQCVEALRRDHCKAASGVPEDTERPVRPANIFALVVHRSTSSRINPGAPTTFNLPGLGLVADRKSNMRKHAHFVIPPQDLPRLSRQRALALLHKAELRG